MKKNTDTKQILFEMMAKIDPTFKPKLNELWGDVHQAPSASGVQPVGYKIGDSYSYGTTGAFTDKQFKPGEYVVFTIDGIENGSVHAVSTDGKYQDNPSVDELNNLIKNRDVVIKSTERVDEADKSSYSDDMVNDIKVLLGTRPALSPKEVQQLATDYQVSPEEVQQTIDYVISTKQSEQQPLPTNSQEAEEVNDFFKFLKSNPQTNSIAHLWYASTLDRYLAKPKQNPMVGKFLKLTDYGFEWARTYAKEVEKVNPDWEIQQRKGDYTEVEGFSVIKRDSKGDEVIDIIPRTPKSVVLILGDTGEVVDTLKSGELQSKYAQYFQPSFFAPYTPSGSGVDFRALKLYATKRIAAGGKEWLNPKFKYEKYAEYFNQIPKGEE